MSIEDRRKDLMNRMENLSNFYHENFYTLNKAQRSYFSSHLIDLNRQLNELRLKEKVMG